MTIKITNGEDKKLNHIKISNVGKEKSKKRMLKKQIEKMKSEITSKSYENHK
jgi:hypothetical protein